ncbi:STAS domain-containing protein [Azonexus sp. IMCC34839]|uniref:STAS domain-containing protein n=1 Tax=Azonexus sp. IMCC34839 TaxID=3133695 RepID=UPI003999F7B9
MNIQSTIADGKLTLRLNGRFQFDCHREFRNAYDGQVGDAKVKTFVLDFSAVDYLDSSALGMLLLLREKATQAHQAVELVGVQGMVKQVLGIANFDRLFKIS